MKTLYINISGENIQSKDDIVIVGKPTDDLAGKFYFELGNQILKGVVVQSVINKRELITEFIQQDKNVYEDKIFPQLEHAKRLMLSNELRGEVKVQLPQEYIQWLNYYGTADYSAIAKSLNEKGGIVTINLSRIYRNGIQLLINSIEPDDYGRLVVNDDAVEDDTEMVVAIRERLKNPMLPFILYTEFVEKEKVCPKCGKKPCICGPEPEKRETFLFVTCYLGNKKDDFVEVEILNEEQETLFKEKCHSVDSVWSEKDDSGNYKVLVLEDYERYLDGEAHRYHRITANSIERNLSESELRQKQHKDEKPSNKDIKNLEKFFPQYKGGMEYIGKSGEDFIFYGIKDEDYDPEDAESVDIITDKGEKLFELKRESGLSIEKVTPSGLFLMEKSHNNEIAYYGIADKHGKELIPCIYGEHKLGKKSVSYYYQSLIHNGKYEVFPGIFTLDNGKSFINAYNGDVYTYVKGDFGLRRKNKDNACLVDIVCLKDNHVIKENVTIDEEAELKDLGDGWYGVDTLERSDAGFGIDELILVFNGKNEFTLNKDEFVYELADQKYFVSEGRIVTGINRGVTWEEVSTINIRDNSGQIIKSVKGGDISLIAPYKFKKLLAKNISNSSLVYYDLSGNEHEISYCVSTDDEVSLVSGNTILISNSRFNKYRLIDVNGNVLLERNEPIVPLNEKYLLLRDRKKYGVVDMKGKMFIEPLYSQIAIIDN